jgi:hypothetical protein
VVSDNELNDEAHRPMPYTALVGADGVREWPVAVVALGDGDPALHPTGDAMAGHHDPDG